MKTKTIISTVAIAIISCITVFNLQAQETRRTAFGEPALICRCLPQSVEITRVITGSVTNERGEPFFGVSIREKGSNRAGGSNIRGGFSIVVSENAILQFSRSGYLTQEIIVDNQREVNVVMKSDPEFVNETVVFENTVVSENTIVVPAFEERRIGGWLERLERRIQGVVRENQTNEPLIGVRVSVQGTDRGTRTDFDGRFSINIPDSPLDATLQPEFWISTFFAKSLKGLILTPSIFNS